MWVGKGRSFRNHALCEQGKMGISIKHVIHRQEKKGNLRSHALLRKEKVESFRNHAPYGRTNKKLSTRISYTGWKRVGVSKLAICGREKLVSGWRMCQTTRRIIVRLWSRDFYRRISWQQAKSSEKRPKRSIALSWKVHNFRTLPAPGGSPV